MSKRDLDRPRGFDKDAEDWEITPFGSLGGGTAVGVGLLLFGFRSLSLRHYLKFQFVGAGVGAGLFAGFDPQSTSRLDCSLADWRPLGRSIKSPFSSLDLADSTGRAGVFAAATPGKAGWGYTRLILTAECKGNLLFDQFELAGYGLGSGGLAAGLYWGKWMFLGHPEGKEMGPNWTEKKCID